MLGMVALLIAGLLNGQQPVAPTRSFEAASIKPLKSSEGPTQFTLLPNRLDVKNMGLRFLIQQAYELQDLQVTAPEWTITHHFDIVATTAAPVSKTDMRVMLRDLLIERFHLVTHWNTRTEALFRLEVLPGGPKMKASADGYAVPNSPMKDGNSWQLNGPMSMPQLAQRLTPFARKPVLDGTNLEGYFLIPLTFAFDDYDPALGGAVPPSLTTAVEKQLGLKLVPAKEPIKILVVDHADTVPVAN